MMTNIFEYKSDSYNGHTILNASYSDKNFHFYFTRVTKPSDKLNIDGISMSKKKLGKLITALQKAHNNMK